jgi:hypothetical protein
MPTDFENSEPIKNPVIPLLSLPFCQIMGYFDPIRDEL